MTPILCLKRVLRRIKNAIKVGEIYSWDFESCDRCGGCVRWCYWVNDDIWIDVFRNTNGCFCLDCLLYVAKTRNITIVKEHFKMLEPMVW